MSADRKPRTGWRNFYGRRHGKTLRDTQKTHLENDLAALTLTGVSPEANPDRVPLDPQALFGARPVWLEIGFGGGEHMVHQAVQNPEVAFVGAEPFINGVAMLLGKIAESGVESIRIHPGDVRDLFDVLPDGSIEKAFLLYPDPWPKTRHHRRRFVTPDHLQPLARVLAPGAEFRVATDIPDYVRQTLEEVPKAGFVRDTSAAIHSPWADWTPTRYERKAQRQGRVPHYLTFHRR